MTTTTASIQDHLLKQGPTWATSVSVADPNTDDEWVEWRATLGAITPVYDWTHMEREFELRVSGHQFSTNTGELPAKTPLLEVAVYDSYDGADAGIHLTADDARKLAQLLLQAADKITDPAVN